TRVARVRGVVDLAERDAALGGDPGAVVVLRTKGRGPVAQPSQLPPHPPEWRFDLDGLTLQFVPADRISADAQGRRLAEEDLLECRDPRPRAQDRHPHPPPGPPHPDPR